MRGMREVSTAPVCAAADHTSVPAIAAVTIERFIIIGLNPWRLTVFLGTEQPKNLPIRGDELAQHAPCFGDIPGAKTLDGDLNSRLDNTRLVAVAKHSARRTGLECPLLHFSIRALHVEKEPRMRVFQQHLGDHTFN